MYPARFVDEIGLANSNTIYRVICRALQLAEPALWQRLDINTFLPLPQDTRSPRQPFANAIRSQLCRVATGQRSRAQRLPTRKEDGNDDRACANKVDQILNLSMSIIATKRDHTLPFSCCWLCDNQVLNLAFAIGDRSPVVRHNFLQRSLAENRGQCVFVAGGTSRCR